MPLSAPSATTASTVDRLPDAPRVAVVHDWLDTWRGGENVLADVLALYPQATLYALVDFLDDAARARIGGRRARTSFLQRLPGARRRFRMLLPLFPRAIESLDVSGHDIVISISHAVAKGVRTHRGQVHLCYCLTPMRYAWDLRETYLASAGASRGVRRLLAGAVLDRLQRWDARSARRVDAFVAISGYIRDRIRRSYGCDAVVVYPAIDTEYFTPGTDARTDAYLTASRWVPYKRLDLIVEAFRASPRRRLLVGGEGPELARVRRKAPANVEFLGELTREALRQRMRESRAFVFAAEEDFGITPLEAQACGTPVVAFARGGTVETINDGADADRSGVLFAEQSAEAIAEAIDRFERDAVPIASDACRNNALRFAPAGFRERFTAEVERTLRAPPARDARAA
jgi:glycosyltransferase involved in cell wall biosynthesis